MFKQITITVATLLSLAGCVENIGNKQVDNHATNTTTIVQTKPSENVGDTAVVDTTSELEIPTFNGNSQGKLLVQCEDDIVYYLMAYDCLKPDTKPTVTTTGGEQTVDVELGHEGEVFYTKGHVDRTGGEVIVTGRVFSGGKWLDKVYQEVCK